MNLSSEEIKAIKTLADKPLVDVALDEIEIRTGTYDIIVAYNDIDILSFSDELNISRLERLIEFHNDRFKEIKEENITGWVKKTDTEAKEVWETKVGEETVKIEPDSDFSTWYLKISGRTPDEFETRKGSNHIAIRALLCLYLENTNGYKVGYNSKIREVAIETFTQLKGIGKSTARDLVYKKQIQSFEKLSERPYALPARYRDSLEERVNELAGTDSEPENQEEIQRIKEKSILDNI